VTREYVPDAGHLVWLGLDPQRGRRPFLVLSPRAYNAKTSLALGVRITSRRSGYPLSVDLPAEGAITGVVLADQLTTLDWRARCAEFAANAHPNTLRDVRALIATLLDVR
jgi:mRNA interferase MazF